MSQKIFTPENNPQVLQFRENVKAIATEAEIQMALRSNQFAN
jgi:hypothetical protein